MSDILNIYGLRKDALRMETIKWENFLYSKTVFSFEAEILRCFKMFVPCFPASQALYLTRIFHIVLEAIGNNQKLFWKSN